MSLDIAIAARRHLADSSALTTLLGSGQGYDTWIFTGQDANSKPYIPMEGTKKACVMVRQQGGWTSPNQHNNMKFPLLVIEVFLDPGRDGSANVINPNLRPIFNDIWTVLDQLLHVPQGGAQMWSTLRILGSHKISEWDVFPFTETDGVKTARATFGVSVG